MEPYRCVNDTDGGCLCYCRCCLPLKSRMRNLIKVLKSFLFIYIFTWLQHRSITSWAWRSIRSVGVGVECRGFRLEWDWLPTPLNSTSLYSAGARFTFGRHIYNFDVNRKFFIVSEWVGREVRTQGEPSGQMIHLMKPVIIYRNFKREIYSFARLQYIISWEIPGNWSWTCLCHISRNEKLDLAYKEIFI